METQRFKITPHNQQDSVLLVTDTKYKTNFWVPKMSHGKPSPYHLQKETRLKEKLHYIINITCTCADNKYYKTNNFNDICLLVDFIKHLTISIMNKAQPFKSRETKTSFFTVFTAKCANPTQMLLNTAEALVIADKRTIDWITTLKQGDVYIEVEENKDLCSTGSNQWCKEIRYIPVKKFASYLGRIYNRYSTMIA